MTSLYLKSSMVRDEETVKGNGGRYGVKERESDRGVTVPGESGHWVKYIRLPLLKKSFPSRSAYRHGGLL